jgi:N,N-dimethylformamidase
MGVAYDVVTDHDLHGAKGVEILKSYKVVLTGSHPSTTQSARSTRQTYTETGGRLMYLGGNGFYWRVALTDKVPGAIEIRRTGRRHPHPAGRAGRVLPPFDGAYGGLWRRSPTGRPSFCAASASRARAPSSAITTDRQHRRRATIITPDLRGREGRGVRRLRFLGRRRAG